VSPIINGISYIKINSILAGALTSLALMACGGGGGDAAHAAAVNTPSVLTDKYTATWKSCRSDGVLRTLAISKKSEGNYAFDFKATAHDGGYTCAGEGTAIADSGGISGFQVVGTKEVLGSVAGLVDKIIDADSGEKDILFVKDRVIVTDSASAVTLLYYTDSSSSSTIDSDGFPNSLDTFLPYRKQ
jgi:hypothetical protein